MIVATVLLAIGVVGTQMCIGSAVRATVISQKYRQAGLLARQELTELQTDSTQMTAGEHHGDFGQNYPDYTWSSLVETTQYPILFKVTLTVNWTDGQANRSVQLVTYAVTPTTSSTGTTNPLSGTNTGMGMP